MGKKKKEIVSITIYTDATSVTFTMDDLFSFHLFDIAEDICVFNGVTDRNKLANVFMHIKPSANVKDNYSDEVMDHRPFRELISNDMSSIDINYSNGKTKHYTFRFENANPDPTISCNLLQHNYETSKGALMILIAPDRHPCFDNMNLGKEIVDYDKFC